MGAAEEGLASCDPGCVNTSNRQPDSDRLAAGVMRPGAPDQAPASPSNRRADVSAPQPAGVAAFACHQRAHAEEACGTCPRNMTPETLRDKSRRGQLSLERACTITARPRAKGKMRGVNPVRPRRSKRGIPGAVPNPEPRTPRLLRLRHVPVAHDAAPFGARARAGSAGTLREPCRQQLSRPGFIYDAGGALSCSPPAVTEYASGVPPEATRLVQCARVDVDFYRSAPIKLCAELRGRRGPVDHAPRPHTLKRHRRCEPAPAGRQVPPGGWAQAGPVLGQPSAVQRVQRLCRRRPCARRSPQGRTGRENTIAAAGIPQGGRVLPFPHHGSMMTRISHLRNVRRGSLQGKCTSSRWTLRIRWQIPKRSPRRSCGSLPPLGNHARRAGGL